MKPRTFAPRKLDMAAFIQSGEGLDGELPVTDLPRLAAGLAEDASIAALEPVTWRAAGRVLPQRVGPPHLWLDLSARAALPLACQRCLHPVTVPLVVSRSIRFVADEAAAADLDADGDDDVLALSKQFDLMDLIEDELIMAQPIVPRHDTCPTDVRAVMRGDEPEVDGDAEGALTPSGRPNPFAVLASLKKGRD